MCAENYKSSQKLLTEYEYSVSLRRLADQLEKVCPAAANVLKYEADLYARLEPRKPRVWWVNPEDLTPDPRNARCIKVTEEI